MHNTIGRGARRDNDRNTRGTLYEHRSRIKGNIKLAEVVTVDMKLRSKEIMRQLGHLDNLATNERILEGPSLQRRRRLA